MVTDGGQDLGLASDVLPAEVEEMAVPMPLDELKPWHRPRKQFIRERQWVKCAEFLFENLTDRNARSIQSGKISYLTLPGVDYFDVEVLAGLAKKHGLDLEVLGFLAEADKEPAKARSQFRADSLIKKGLITDGSMTYPYRFEDLSSKRSQAYLEAKRRAPFSVINVDACGSIARPNAGQAGRIIDALFRLLEIQFNYSRERWLLFLTSDVREDSLSRNVINRLDDAIIRNAKESRDFRSGVMDGLGNAGEELEDVLSKAEGNPERFLAKFSLGVAKWLIHNADNVMWDVKCRPFFCYSTREFGAQDPSMPCLAFEFRPREIFMRDVVGASALPNDNKSSRPSVAGVTQKYSMEALGQATKMKDVDVLFADDGNLAREFATKQRRLLEGAGYKDVVLKEFDGLYFS